MSGVGLEILLEGLVPEIAYSGEKGVSISSLLKIVRQYHNSLNVPELKAQENGAGDPQAQAQDGNIDSTFTDAEMTSARWAWDWLRSRPQILINGNKRYNRLELSEVLALPEAPESSAATDGAQPPPTDTLQKKEKDQKSKKSLTFRPRIHPSEDLVWQTLTRHGVDYKRVPVLEWKCLLGIASVRGEGILQSDLRKLVDQDKRSLPKRTDSLARKGYIAKRTIVVSRMKTSKLWLIDFAPPISENESGGLDLSPETLTKDLEPVTWHGRWTGNNIDMEAFGRTFVGIIKAWGVIRYSDLRYKMGVGGKPWQMKTLAKNSQRFVDMGVLKYTAAAFPGSRKVFKDCLKFIREPRPEEWDKFLATGKKTSQYSDATRHREPKPNALAVYGESGQDKEKGTRRQKSPRIFEGWTPEKPLAQSVFEVVKSAGPNGASNPQISVATVGYAFRRYMASHLNKVAEMQQPPHLKKFQITSKLVRSGKTSAYMFSAQYPNGVEEAVTTQIGEATEETEQVSETHNDPFGFGPIRRGAFASEGLTLSDLNRIARKPSTRRKDRTIVKMEEIRQKEAPDATLLDVPEGQAEAVDKEQTPHKGRRGRPPKRKIVESEDEDEAGGGNTNEVTQSIEAGNAVEEVPLEDATMEESQQVEVAPAREPGAYLGKPGSLNPYPTRGRPKPSVVVTIYSERLKDPTFLGLSQGSGEVGAIKNEDPGETGTTDGALAVRYNGNTGQLRFSKKDRTLVFSEEGKPPLIIPINSINDDPSVQAVTEGDDKSLVFVLYETEDGITVTHTFLFDDDAESRRQAAFIQQGVIATKATEAGIEVTVDQIAPEDAPQDDEEYGEFVPERSTSTRGRGGGRGGRGRGGATRGRGVRRGQAFPGAPFKCETCGGTWKNDVGLKYHQTKAQVPCNPNFDPNAVPSRKRRRLSPVPETPPAASLAASGDEGEDGEPLTRRRRTTKSTSVKEVAKVGATAARNKRRPKVRNAVRSVQGAALLFRGIAVDVDETMPDVPREARIRAPKTETMTQPSVIIAPESSQHFSMKINSVLGGEGAQSSAAIEDTAMVDSEVTTADGVIVETGDDIDMVAAPEPAPLQSVVSPVKTSPVKSTEVASMVDGESAPVPTSAEATATTADDSDKQSQPQETDPKVPHPEVAQHIVHPAYLKQGENASSQRSPSKRKRAEGQDEVFDGPGAEIDDQEITKPFERSTNYDLMATDAKRRTAQAYDIINYLLDNNCGVFPGDKALFYALVKVFLKEFRGQIPPTWKNCHSAIKAMETRKLAAVHTHMLRIETGKLATLSLVIRDGVDPMGQIPTFMKQKMRDTYPTIYIPAAFSPTKEELDFLQELDGKPVLPAAKPITKPNANGEKFRSRRKIDEVEVFNAPYYTQAAHDNAPEYKDPFWDRGKNGYQRGENLPSERHDEEEGGGRGGAVDEHVGAENGRGDAPGPELEGPKPTSAAMAQNSEPQTKEQEQKPHETISQSQSQTHTHQQVNISSPFGAKRRRYKKRAPIEPRKATVQTTTQSITPASQIWKGGSPTVSEAIAVYNLLPARPGKRGRPRIHPARNITKQLPHLGRVRNPGLGSLPTSFFTWTPNGPEKPETREGQTGESSRVDVPTSAKEMASRTPGAAFSPDTFVDESFGKFWSVVHRCEAWELSQPGTAALTGPKIAPDHGIINISPPVAKSNMRSVNLKWSDDRTFNLETLPYQDLDEIAGDDDEIPVDCYNNNDSNPQAEPRPAKKRRVGVIPRRRTGVGGRPTKFKLQAIKTGRELTAYPTSNNDFLRIPGDEKEEMDWTSENIRLTAFIVVSTLLGGVDRVIDWGLMMRLFPDMTISQLRHAWCALKKDRQSTIAALTEKFRTSFLKAYASGELPPIDFNNAAAYDWKSLIKWTTELDGFERVSLPASRQTLEQKFVLPNCRFENREWRESYYHVQRSVFNKFQDACSEPVSFPAYEEARNHWSKSSPDLNLAVAMSWTRSLCVTPVDMYTTERILKKRNTLLPGMSKSEITDVILQGIDQLQREGIISKSTAKWSNGRRWRFNNRVPETLDKICHESKLAQAVAFKEKLDASFRLAPGDDLTKERRKRISYVTKDGMIMTLLNLQAMGRVRLETTGQPNVPMGHEPGNYETRKYTKKYLHFRVDVIPTERYVFNEDKEITSLRTRLEDAPPPTRGPGGATPAWCDVFEKVDMGRWVKYLSMVLNMVASRGAMPAEELAKTLKPVIMLFEVEMILEWGKRLGILGRQMEVEGGDGRKMGTALAAREWWWFAVDAQRRRGVSHGELPLGSVIGTRVGEGEGELGPEGEKQKQLEGGEGVNGVGGGSAEDIGPSKTESSSVPRARKPLPNARRRTAGEEKAEEGEESGNGDDV